MSRDHAKNTFSGTISTSWTVHMSIFMNNQNIMLSFAMCHFCWMGCCLPWFHSQITCSRKSLNFPTKQTLRGAYATNITNRSLTLAFSDTHETLYGSLLYLLRHLTLTPPNFLSYCCLPKCHCFCCITMVTVAVPSVPILPLPITFSSPKFAAKTFYVLKLKI